MLKTPLSFLLVLLCSFSAWAQTRQLTGKVTDAANAGIVSASVKVKGQRGGTSTDADGNFSLTVPTGNIVLEVSSIGYATREINVGADENNISISLSESAEQMSEVVVTALGIRREKRAIGASIAEVKGEELVQARSNNFMNNLAGRVAGLNVTSTATGAGGSSRVIIRGNNSIFGNNQPLYVIDGIPIDNSNRGSAGEWGGRDAGDGIQMVNPDEIESVTVLKGGSAAALYGSRAANGVILITTKRGTKRKGLGVEVNSNFVIESVMNVTDWQYEYGHGSLGAKPASATEAANFQLNSWGARLDGSPAWNYDGQQRPYVAQKDNLKNFYENGTNFTNTVSMYGGADKMTYYFTFTDLNNQSFVPNSNLRRNNFSLNVGMNPVERLNVTVSARYIRERVRNRPRLSDSPGNANFTVGLLPTSLDVRTFRESMALPDGSEWKFNGNDFVTNPYWATDVFKQNDARDRIISSVEARYDFTDWLYTRARVGGDFYTRTNFEVTPTGTRYNPGGQINDQSTNKFREFNGELILGAQKEFDKFGVEGFVGGNLMTNIDETQSFWGNNFFTPGFYHISNLQQRNDAYNYREFRINSAFFSAEANYNRWLYLTVTGRNDWFSTISPENWSLFYPSVSSSAILSDVLKMPKAVNFFKVRASWAKVGGQRDPYGTQLTYGLQNPYNGLPVGSINGGTIPNANLLPFEVTTAEAGIEARFLNNRLGVEFTYYNKKTENDIVASQISSTSGFNSVLLNIGEVSNKGVELLLTGGPVRNKNFRWDVTFNMGYNKGVVEKISDQLDQARVSNARSLTAFVDQIEGELYGQIVGFDFRRNEKGEIVTIDGRPQRGNLINYGTGVSPWQLGLNNEFGYKQFFASFLIDGRFGGVMYSGTNDFAAFRGLSKETLPNREGGLIVDGANVDGSPNTTAITAQTYWQSTGLNVATPFIYKSDFVKLRQIIIGYNLPEKLMARTPFKGASISIVGRNLFILYRDAKNIDPESTYNSGNGQGLEWYGVPPLRSFGANLNLKF